MRTAIRNATGSLLETSSVHKELAACFQPNTQPVIPGKTKILLLFFIVCVSCPTKETSLEK